MTLVVADVDAAHREAFRGRKIEPEKARVIQPGSRQRRDRESQKNPIPRPAFLNHGYGRLLSVCVEPVMDEGKATAIVLSAALHGVVAILIVAVEPDSGFVAAQRSPVQPLIHAPKDVQSARV